MHASDPSAQIAALQAAAEYVKDHFGPVAFTGKSPFAGQQETVREFGEQLAMLAHVRSRGGEVTYQQIDVVVDGLNRAGFFLDEETWSGVVKAFPPEC
jgi:hypothetical protein